MKRKMSTLVLIGRRWFNRGPGNTYHSVEIIVDGKHVHKVDYAYGYGDQWIYTALEWLDQNGYMPDHQKNKNTGGCEPVWRYCERKNIQFVYSCTDVPRKKDL